MQHQQLTTELPFDFPRSRRRLSRLGEATLGCHQLAVSAMLSKLFSTAVKPVILSSQPAASSYPYQTLRRDDDGESPNDGERTDDPSQASDAESKVHRDAAAMMLIKLGRSPDEIITVSPADDARILRRIDLALLPLMLSVYFLQALDKATLSYASIFGLIDDTDLVGDEFSWLGSIVYLAQLIMQLPLAWALVKLPIGKFTSAMVLAWGITLTGMTWAHNFGQLMTARFFLGAFEACVGPAFVAITQMWWRRRYFLLCSGPSSRLLKNANVYTESKRSELGLGIA